MTQIDAVKQLHKLGARFILCEGKQPKGGLKGLYEKKRPNIYAVLNHLEEGGTIGIEPFSLGFGVIDVDGVGKDDPDCKDKNDKLCVNLVKFMTSTGLGGRHPSLSFNETGRRHVWYRIDTDNEAPLGVKANGEPYKSAPTDMLLDGKQDNHFDIRFRNSYVICSHYLIQLASFLHSKKEDGPNPNWIKLIPEGTKHRKKAEKKKAEAVNMVDQKLAYYRKSNTAYLAKVKLPDEGEGHHVIANKVGYKVGSELHFNPEFLAQAEARFNELGLKEERWKSFHKGVEEGENNPAEEPEWLKNIKILLKEISDIRRCREAFKIFEWKFRYDETLNSVERSEKGGKWKPMEKANVDAMWIKVCDICMIEKKGEDDKTEYRDWKVSYNVFDRCITSEALENPFNPIKEFIDSIPAYNEEWGDKCWELFENLGIEKNELNEFASKWIFAPAFYYNSREFYIPVRPIIILTGHQDIGKSAVIREIIPHEFRDRLHGPNFDPSANEKEKIESVLGKVLVESGEMQRHTAKTIESYKAFSQKTMDSNVRLAYRRNTSPLKRTAWLIGTSNKHDCLPLDDTEGQANTRFLPIACNKGFDVEKWMDETGKGNIQNRMKVWAQIKMWVENKLNKGEKLRLPFDMSQQQYARLNKHVYVESKLDMVVEDLTMEIEKKEEKGYTPVGYKIGELMSTEVFINDYLGQRSDFKQSRALEMKLGPALVKSGLWEKKKVRIDKRPRLRWVRTNKTVSSSGLMRYMERYEPKALADIDEQVM